MNWLIEWLIARARRSPYFHLYHGDGSIYMERFWLVRSGTHPDQGNAPATWREPFTWLLQKLGIAARLHCIYTPDLDRALHDHPWTFLSLVLRGWYYEERPVRPETATFLNYLDPVVVRPPEGRPLTVREAALLIDPPVTPVLREPSYKVVRLPGSLALRRFSDRHRISQVSAGGVWTLFVTFRKRQTWGFFTPKGKIWWWEFESVHNNKPISKEVPNG